MPPPLPQYAVLPCMIQACCLPQLVPDSIEGVRQLEMTLHARASMISKHNEVQLLTDPT